MTLTVSVSVYSFIISLIFISFYSFTPFYIYLLVCIFAVRICLHLFDCSFVYTFIYYYFQAMYLYIFCCTYIYFSCLYYFSFFFWSNVCFNRVSIYGQIVQFFSYQFVCFSNTFLLKVIFSINFYLYCIMYMVFLFVSGR